SIFLLVVHHRAPMYAPVRSGDQSGQSASVWVFACSQAPMLRTAIAAAPRPRISLAPARFAHELAQAQAQSAVPGRDDLDPSWVPLYRTISRLYGRPPGMVAAEMDNYLRKRRPLSADQIVAYVRKLRKFKSNACALELMDWMESRGAKLHQALRLGLVSKVHGIQAAEEYFWSLPDKSKETYSCLLNCYGEHGMACKGLELYEKMKVMDIVPNTLLYNSLMTLYQKAGQPEKIPSTFEEMRESEKVLEELEKVAPVHWSLYTLMANSYIKLELFGKSEVALKKAEEVMDKAELLSILAIQPRLRGSGSLCSPHSRNA
uniref:Pentacotripeptide-repeat region of PRORP domain-containing protein n=1 Tax=Aegilops tauschii subsp. strangulata TaxID=200361 RepID=A0A453N6C0_AEGTS